MAFVLFNTNAFASTKEASNFVNDLAGRVIEVVVNPKLSDNDKEKKLDQLFSSSVDLKWIAKFSLGKYWRDITPEQQNNFVRLYSLYITNLYVPNFKKYTGNQIKVLKSIMVRENEYLVRTEITDALQSTKINIDYRIMQDDNGTEKFLIFDVIAEGVSLITTQRAELNSIMSNGDFNSLMAQLSSKVRKTQGK